MAIMWIPSKYSPEYLKACVGNAVVGEVQPEMHGFFWNRKKIYVAKSVFYTPEENFRQRFGKRCQTIEEARRYIEDTFAEVVKIYNKYRNYGLA